MSLEDTSNESSQQDESLPHNNSTEETQCSTDDVKDSDEEELIIEAKLYNQKSDNELPPHNNSTEGTHNPNNSASDSEAT